MTIRPKDRKLAELILFISERSEGDPAFGEEKPEFGARLEGNPPRWFVAMPDIAERPLGIVYTFDDERLLMLGIWIS